MNSRIIPVLKESFGIFGIVAMTVALLCQASGSNTQAFVSLAGNGSGNGEETAAVFSWENLDPSDDALDIRRPIQSIKRRPILAYDRSR